MVKDKEWTSIFFLVEIILTAIFISGLYVLFMYISPQTFSWFTLFCFFEFYIYALNEIALKSLGIVKGKTTKKYVNLDINQYGYNNIVLSVFLCIFMYFGVLWMVSDFCGFVVAISLYIIVNVFLGKKKLRYGAIGFWNRFKKNRILLLTSIGSLVLISGVNYYIRYDKTFQLDSENLVNSAIVVDKYDLEYEGREYGLGSLASNENPKANSYMINDNPRFLDGGYSFYQYKSQVGLQGWVYRSLSHFFYIRSLTIYRLANCLLLAFIVFAISWQLYLQYNEIFALSFIAISLTEKWITNFSANLYWVEFSWYIPILLSLILLNYPHYKLYIYIGYFIAIFSRCLCGYEYISSIMFSGIVFLIVNTILDKNNRREKVYSLISVCIISFLGFVVAFMLHSYIYGEGEIISGMKMIMKDVVGRRTFGDFKDYDVIYKSSLTASVGDVLKRYLFQRTGIEISFITLIAIMSILIQNKDRLFKAILMLTGVIAPLSWFVLGKAHSYIHVHMNYVLWYLGYVQIAVFVILDSVLAKRSITIKDSVNDKNSNKLE